MGPIASREGSFRSLVFGCALQALGAIIVITGYDHSRPCPQTKTRRRSTGLVPALLLGPGPKGEAPLLPGRCLGKRRRNPEASLETRQEPMSQAEFLLAVDGGGTKTQAMIADLGGKVLARGLGPSSNHHRVGFDQCGRALATAIDGALQNAMGGGGRGEAGRWREAKIAAACFGLAGVDGPEDEAEIAGWVKAQKIAPSFMVCNDSELVLAAGTPVGWGVALVSGTGSVCLGRSAAGRALRVGGWGPILGDEGSGYQIALAALRLATQTADGRASAEGLLKGVLAHWSLRGPESLIAHVHAPTMTQAEIAGLAAVVLSLASRGDQAAGAIVDHAARDLARQVDAAARGLSLQSPPLALAGGVLRGSLRSALLAKIETKVGPVQFVPDPSIGAVVLARRLLVGSSRPS